VHRLDMGVFYLVNHNLSNLKIKNGLLRNVKRPCVSIYCDINTMGVVEHERCLRGVSLTDFSSALQLPECLYHSI
jgi:hypothetical protein